MLYYVNCNCFIWKALQQRVCYRCRFGISFCLEMLLGQKRKDFAVELNVNYNGETSEWLPPLHVLCKSFFW